MSKKEFKDPFDGEYVGNIWGWKFSLIGLVVILLSLGLLIYRHYSSGIPFGEDVNVKIENKSTIDTINTDSIK